MTAGPCRDCVKDALQLAAEYGPDGVLRTIFDDAPGRPNAPGGEKANLAAALVTLAHAYRQIEASL